MFVCGGGAEETDADRQVHVWHWFKAEAGWTIMYKRIKKISLERNGKSGIIINHNNGQTSCLYKHVLGDVDAP